MLITVTQMLVAVIHQEPSHAVATKDILGMGHLEIVQVSMTIQ